jgi:hypothetical protein
MNRRDGGEGGAISEGIFRKPRRPVNIHCEMTEQKPNFAEYSRQGAACLALAQLTDIPSIKVRWLRMARTWFTLAEKTIEVAVAETSPKTDAPNVVPLRPNPRGSQSPNVKANKPPDTQLMVHRARITRTTSTENSTTGS